jgi:hypothetical protein
VLALSFLRWPRRRRVRAGTLDDPEVGKPQITIWTSSAPSWAVSDPNIPSLERAHPARPKVSGFVAVAVCHFKVLSERVVEGGAPSQGDRVFSQKKHSGVA